MLSNVDEDEKTTRTISTTGSNYQTEAWFLTENGLYEVLMLSRKPKAKQFKSKVKEILKSVRMTGGYIIPTLPLLLAGFHTGSPQLMLSILSSAPRILS